MNNYFHACETFYQFGKCRCFDDIVNAVGDDGRWFYWHDGIFTQGDGLAVSGMLGRPVVGGEIAKTADEIANLLGVTS